MKNIETKKLYYPNNRLKKLLTEDSLIYYWGELNESGEQKKKSEVIFGVSRTKWDINQNIIEKICLKTNKNLL